MKITGLGYLIKEGFKNVWHNRIMSIASVCVLVSCLVLTGSAVLFSRNVAQVVDSVSDSNETTFYIKENLSRVEAVYIGRDIAKVKNVADVEYYSKDEAIKKYKKTLGEDIFQRMADASTTARSRTSSRLRASRRLRAAVKPPRSSQKSTTLFRQ